MPARVHTRPEVVRTPSEKYHEHDQRHSNKNVQHKEALRLALGSILTPKRSFTPSSRSSSGTASPAHPASFTPSPPHSIPSHGTDAGRADTLLHPRNPFFPLTPSRLGHSESSDHSLSSSAAPSPSSLQPTKSHESSPPPLLALPEPAVSDHPQKSEGQVYAIRAPKPVSAPLPGASPTPPTTESTGCSGSGSGTPKAKFIETLQSKSAWDALIHGSFS